MQICIDVIAVFDIKMVWFVGFCSWLSGKQGGKQERMDFVSYGVEKCIDVAAALLLRVGLKFVDRLFVNDSATADVGDSGVSVTVVDVPIGSVGDPGAEGGTVFMIGTGSGAGTVSVDGDGPMDGAPAGGLPGDCIVDMLDVGDSDVRVTVVDVPMGSGTGSGTGSFVVEGYGSLDGDPVGGQPGGCVVDMMGGAEVALGFTEAE